MYTEATLFQAMQAQVQPVPVWRLHAPQADDLQPVQTPYVIFSREQFSGADLENFCDADASLTDSYIVDCLHHDYAGARELNRQMTAVFRAFKAAPDSVFEDYDAAMRVYRVTSLFTFGG